MSLSAEDYERAKKALAEALHNKNPDPSRIDKGPRQDLDIILSNAESGKAALAVVITSLVKKIITPSQDIRIHQTNMQGGYSGRGLDTKVVTPFIRTNDFPFMSAGSGWLTRSFEQRSPYTLDYKGSVKPLELKKAFLSILDNVQKGKLDPKKALEYLFAGLEAGRDKNASLKLAKPTGLSIETVVHYLDQHFMYDYKSSGASRLPVLAIYAAYMQMMKEVSRYKGFTLPALLRHNAADKKTDTIGDIQVLDAEKRIVEAVEIKHLIEITPTIIDTAYKKFKSEPVKRYYLLTTSNANSHAEANSKASIDIQKKCGCQVIANGVEPTLKYYLRLLENPDTFIIAYAELLEKDQDIKYEHREAWNKIVSGT